MATPVDRRRVLKALAATPALAFTGTVLGALDAHRKLDARSMSAMPGHGDADWSAFRLDGPNPTTALLFGGDSWTFEGESAAAFAKRADRRWHRLVPDAVPGSASSSASIVVMANPDDLCSFRLAYLCAIRASQSHNNVVLLAAQPDPVLEGPKDPWRTPSDTARYIAQVRFPEEKNYFLRLIEDTAKEIPSSYVDQGLDCRVFSSLNADTSIYLTGYSTALQHIVLGSICVDDRDVRNRYEACERERWWEGADAQGDRRATRAAEEAFRRLPSLEPDCPSHVTVNVSAGPEFASSEIQEVRRLACAHFHACGTSMLLAVRVEDARCLSVSVHLTAPKSIGTDGHYERRTAVN